MPQLRVLLEKRWSAPFLIVQKKILLLGERVEERGALASWRGSGSFETIFLFSVLEDEELEMKARWNPQKIWGLEKRRSGFPTPSEKTSLFVFFSRPHPPILSLKI